MTRTYTMKKRAQSQAETRQRIVEAAVELHTRFGPAHTTLSMVAERAGVQRHTLYAHFPDERSLQMACSGLHMQRNPLPDAEPWHAIGRQDERLRVGLAALYGWYGRNAELSGCVLRDAEYHPLTKEISALRMGPFMAAYREVLGEKLSERQQAVLQLALNYYTWRTLVRDAGLAPDVAVDVMVRAIGCADRT